jgi:hypothetical protein
MKNSIKKICRFLDSDKEFDCDFEENNDGKEVILEVYNSGNHDYEFQSYHKIIHIEECGNYFTFFSCQSITKSNIKVSYKVEGYFRDVLINSLESIKVKKYSVQLPKYLNCIFESKEFIEDDLNYSYEYLCKINNNFSIQYKSSIKKSKIGNYSVSYELFILLDFIYVEEVDLEIVYNDLNILKQFFDFNSGIKNYIEPSSIIIINNEDIKVSDRILNSFEEQNHLHLSLFNNRFFINTIDDKKKLAGYNFRAFFNFRNEKEEIFRVIKKWYENEKYRVVFQYYIDCNDWLQGSNRLISNVMFNNKFLNVIQALENYHRITFGDETKNIGYDTDFSKNLNSLNLILKNENNEELKKWICNKLKGINKEKREFTLIERLEKIKESCDIMKDIDFSFSSKKTKKKRDSLSHGNINDIFQGRELDVYYNYSLLLLLFSIFKTLEINRQEIECLFNINLQIILKKNEIKENLKQLNK